MNPCRSISQEFSLKEETLSIFKSYLAITSGGMDKQVAQSLNNVFATNIHAQQHNAQKLVYNDFDVAFATGMTFQLIVRQKIEVLEYFCSFYKDMNDKQKYAFDLLKYTIYQLDKSDPELYLNTFLCSKGIPHQLLQPGINLSRLYSFVHLCELDKFFKPFQKNPLLPQTQFSIIPYVFWTNFDNINLKQVSHEIDLYFYQPSATYPILVLQQFDSTQLSYKIFEEHQLYMTHISTQLILDAVSQKLSLTSENLKNQPFKYQSIEALGLILLAGQPNIVDKLEKFKKIPKIDKTLNFLIDTQITQETIKNQILQNLEVEKVQELKEQNQTQTQSFDIFATQIPSNSQAINNLRKTISF